MKIVITGSLGHVSMPLVKQLASQSHHLSVITSSSARKPAIEALGAQAAVGTIHDVKFLTSVFRGADAVYTMLPPPNYTDPGRDFLAEMRDMSRNYAQAIRNAGVRRVVHLSSIGAHMPERSGVILMHHQAEEILGALDRVSVSFMRPVGFYYNLLGFIGLIKMSGMIQSNYGEEDFTSWVAPVDIAHAVAHELNASENHSRVRYVASDELTCNQTARILGEAIGKPDLRWSRIGDEAFRRMLEQAGLTPAAAAGLVEMQARIHDGLLAKDYQAHQPPLGSVKMKDFARDFAAAYHA